MPGSVLVHVWRGPHLEEGHAAASRHAATDSAVPSSPNATAGTGTSPGGWRDYHVLQFESAHTGELFTNTHGGIDTNHATQYEGLLNLLMTADLNRLGIPIPGKIGVLARTTHGRGLSELFVGDTQIVSNIRPTDNIMQVSEYWFECNLIEDRVTLRLGKQDINNDFLVVDMASDLLNLSFGISPSLNVPTYPAATAAVVLIVHATDDLTFKLGVWDGLPKVGNWGFSDSGITLTAAECQYKYDLIDGVLPGTVDSGVLYASPGEIEPGEQVPQVYSIYADWEQMLIREDADAPNDTQGLGIFLQYISAYRKQDVVFPEYFGAGLIHPRPAGRPGSGHHRRRNCPRSPSPGHQGTGRMGSRRTEDRVGS